VARVRPAGAGRRQRLTRATPPPIAGRTTALGRPARVSTSASGFAKTALQPVSDRGRETPAVIRTSCATGERRRPPIRIERIGGLRKWRRMGDSNPNQRLPEHPGRSQETPLISLFDPLFDHSELIESQEPPHVCGALWGLGRCPRLIAPTAAAMSSSEYREPSPTTSEDRQSAAKRVSRLSSRCGVVTPREHRLPCGA